jgi:hypothetical protein
MPTLKEQLEFLISFKHRLAVWEALFQYLDDSFVSKDGRPPQRAIKADGCTVEIVSEDIIEEILGFISNNPIKELKAKIDVVEQLEVMEPGRRRRRHNEQVQEQAQEEEGSEDNPT